MAEAIHGEQQRFPDLETLCVKKCPNLTTLPGVIEAPKLGVLKINGCNFLFPSSPLALWTCFVLQYLTIKRINHTLVYWPEKEFQRLVSLRYLSIKECSGLIGYVKAAPGQPISERSQVLPRLECLYIRDCESLVEVFNIPHLSRRWICAAALSLSPYSESNRTSQH
uniref:Uncharacterized protein n=1 Tax=Setaria viridis TaxID=4556 RepID=A0A4U6UE94_SETVI|nr:hypothetical protein SEVIR_5G164001v2 [Setaria viridis]